MSAETTLPQVPLVLAPLRGVTILAFRRVFAAPLREAGFTLAYSPFVSATSDAAPGGSSLADILGDQPLPLVPQVIGKKPSAVAAVLRAFKDAGYSRADLNAGCPFPMVRRKGRGSGLLDNPDLLARLCETGVKEMGEGNFSVKVRLGVKDPFTLERRVMPVLNSFPLACVTIHARTAEQMYSGAVDMERWIAAAAMSRNPVVYNGDIFTGGFEPRFPAQARPCALMAGRGAVAMTGRREDSAQLALAYMEESERELSGPAPVLGRMKELLAYWKALPRWRRVWPLAKISRTLAELRAAIACA